MIPKNCLKKPSALLKKARFAPIALCLGLFAVGCSLPEDSNPVLPVDPNGPVTPPVDSSDPGPVTPPVDSSELGEPNTVQTYLGYGYDVVKSSYINRGDVKMANPILDQKKLSRDKRIISEPMTQQDFQVSVGSSVKKFYRNMNAGLGINVDGNGGLGAALFSRKFSFEFGVTLDESRIDSNSYLRGHSYRYTRDEYITGMSAQILQEYLTDGFIADLGTRTAAQFLDRYGTHVFVRYYKGGALEFNYAYHGTQLDTDTKLNTALKASISVVNGEIYSNANENSSELESNSVFHYYTYGGEAISAFSVGDLKSNYSSWLNSIETNSDICGIGDFDNSLIPVWELAEAAGLASKAKELENEFNVRAIAAGKALLVKKAKTTTPQPYNSPGSYTFTYSDASPNSPAEIEVYALGAGGGGQGGNDKDKFLVGEEYSGTGGAGGGGAATYMKLAVTESVSFSVVVGSGGKGGNYFNANSSTPGYSGDPGNNGGDTYVTWQNKSITLIAKGRFGGGGKDYVVDGGNGGTYTPPTASGTIYKEGKGDEGKKGSNGDLKEDIKSQGGTAGTIKIGSLPSFGSGAGAVRQKGGNNNKTSAESGGGGSGGYGWNDYGVAGGNGEVRIIVRYYEDE